jgi:uncharacterized membrane protein (DUF106 family)
MVVGIEITVIAIVYVAFSVSIQRKLVDMRKMQEVQETIKQKSKELNELSKNKASQDVLMAKQKEITSLLGQSMRSQLKPMIVVLPIFFVVYYLIFPAVFTTNPSITLPLLAWTLNYRSYFVMVAFVAGMIISFGLMFLDRVRLSRDRRAAEKPLADSSNQ